jgi:hypothetical protein
MVRMMVEPLSPSYSLLPRFVQRTRAYMHAAP